MKLISYLDARRIVLEQAERSQKRIVSVSLHGAVGRILAADVLAADDVPSFDNSAMDGFAIASEEIARAGGTSIKVSGRSAAGDSPARGGEGGAWEIMTGAVMPSGYDTVVPVENISVLSRDAAGRPLTISIDAPTEVGRHVRRAGDDIRAGSCVMSKGDLISTGGVMALAATGTGKLDVFARPSVTVLATGQELVEVGSGSLCNGQIWNSNEPYLIAALTRLGAKVTTCDRVGDDVELFIRQIKKNAVDHDIIVSTGAVSKGLYDFVPEALRNMGAEILFHGVAVRPGKPILYARLPQGTHYFGLAGNPASTAAGLRFFVAPLLSAMQGGSMPPSIAARLTANFTKATQLRHFCKALAHVDQTGQYRVTVLSGQESFKVKPFSNANGWVVIPEDAQHCEAGELVDFIPDFRDDQLAG